MPAYYNEIDPYAAQWLRNLIDAGHIAPGVVDERSIEDVRPSDLAGFTQCHFFAGVGVWSLALRRAGWADDIPVWTGSCPCQPFSAAGSGAGFADARHLWPSFAWLIKQCGPPVIFGEQVASKAVEPWVDLVHADLEAMEYAFGAVPFPSAGVGAPHIRDRLYWVADSNREPCGQRRAIYGGRHSRGDAQTRPGPGRSSLSVELANAEHGRCQAGQPKRSWPGSALSSGSDGGLANADGWNPSAEREQRGGEQRQQPEDGRDRELVGMGNTDGKRVRWLAGTVLREEISARREVRSEPDAAQSSSPIGRPGPVNGFWRAADWLGCRDDKWRPVEPGTFPLAHGAASRVGRLRAYGNAINAEAATQFIAAYLES